MIALCLVLRFCVKEFHKNLFAIGSTPDDGSSKNYISGPPINANVTHNFLLFPPDNLPDFTFL